MRKLLYPLLFLPFIAFAQPTILQEHLPQAGQIFLANNDYQGGPQFLPTPPAPAPQVWDYTTAFGTTAEEEIVFLPATNAPGSEYFPSSTLALNYNFGISTISVFYSNGPEGFKVEGFYNNEEGSHTSITTHENDIHIPVPLTYGNSTTVNALETAITIQELGGAAEMHRIRTERIMTADAYGTIHTPAYPDGVEVVRHRYETVEIIDSAFTDPSGTGNGPWQFVSADVLADEAVDYNYLQAEQPVFVMEIAGDGSFAVYYDSEITTSISAIISPTVGRIYPNPATTSITMEPGLNIAHRLQIMDASGRICEERNIGGADQLQVNTASWAAGMYTYLYLDANGMPVEQGRFGVVK